MPRNRHVFASPMTETHRTWKAKSSEYEREAIRLRDLESGRPSRRYILGQPNARNEMEAALARWDSAHPEVVELRNKAEQMSAELEDLARQCSRIDLEWDRHQVLDDVPRIRDNVRQELHRTEAIDAVDEFQSKPDAWCLLLLGGIGCGKSTAAGKLLVKTEKGTAPFYNLWVRVSEVSRMSGFGVQTEERYAEMRSAPVIVFDDLGTEVLTPTWQQALDDVLDWRYQHSKRTIITSNLAAGDFKARYGERLADRIREGGMVKTLGEGSLRGRSQG